MTENPFKDRESKDIQLDGETAVIGNEYTCRASSFPLQDGSKALVNRDALRLKLTDVVAKLAQETNLAMNNEQSHKGRRIEMSPTYPIEPGDLVLFCAVGFSYNDENNDPQYVDLVKRNPNIQLFCYKIMQKDGEAMSSRFFLDASVVTKIGKSCGYIVGYLNAEGEPRVKYVTNSTCFRDIVMPSVRPDEDNIVEIRGQLLSHVKYSDKKVRKKLSEEPEQQPTTEQKTFEKVNPEDTTFIGDLASLLEREASQKGNNGAHQTKEDIYDLSNRILQRRTQKQSHPRSNEPTRISPS